MKNLVVALLFSAVSAVSASAADLPAKTYTKEPVMVAPVYSWSGFYVGGNVGADWQNASFTSDVVSCRVLGCGTGLAHIGSDPAVGPAGTGSNTAAGFTGGGQIGINWQVSSLVLGGKLTSPPFPASPRLVLVRFN